MKFDGKGGGFAAMDRVYDDAAEVERLMMNQHSQ